MRLMVKDQPGVIADVAAILRDFNVSMQSFLQHGRAPDEAVPVVFTTHDTSEASILDSLQRIGQLATVCEQPRLMRVLDQL